MYDWEEFTEHDETVFIVRELCLGSHDMIRAQFSTQGEAEDEIRRRQHSGRIDNPFVDYEDNTPQRPPGSLSGGELIKTIVTKNVYLVDGTWKSIEDKNKEIE